MKKQDFKHIFISIIIGAGMAFFSTLFSELAAFFKAHSTEVLPAATSSIAYLFQKRIS